MEYLALYSVINDVTESPKQILITFPPPYNTLNYYGLRNQGFNGNLFNNGIERLYFDETDTSVFVLYDYDVSGERESSFAVIIHWRKGVPMKSF